MDADEIQVHETTPLSAVEEIELCPVEETSINPHQAILQQQDDDDSTSCSEAGGPVCEHLKHLVTNGDVPLGDVEEDVVAPLATPEDLSSLSSVSLQSLSDSKNSPSDSKSSVVESAKSEEEFLEEEQEEEEEEPGEDKEEGRSLRDGVSQVDETDDEYEGYCYPVDPFAIQVLPLPGSETARACAHYAAKKTHQAMERTREVYVRGKERWGEVYVRGRERVGEAYVHSKERMGEAAVKAKDRMEWAVVGTREAMGETLVRSKEAMRKTKEAMGETMRETKQVVAEKVEHSKEVIERGVERTKEVGKKVVEALWQLMPHHALPEWLKDNEYLKGSHRPPMPSFRSCFRSMFRIHSETGNIWTHFLGCLAFIAVAIYFLVKRSSADMHSPLTEKFVCGAFFLGAVLCLGFSWIFHTVYCHSERAAKIFGRLDYSGISLMIMGSFVPWLYYTYYCKEVAQYTYLAIVMALGIICIVISLWEKFSEPRYRAFRACMFLGLGCSGVVPVIHYLISDGFNMAVTAGQVGWLGLMGLLYIVGAVMYATRVPERFFPGKFDLWFHSHQIFHVLVVAAAFVHYHGMNKMADYRFHAGPCTTIP
ncbi:Adiponectin receptor protein 2 [Branchiostoma belcheri]|nr:Adiponectin receptor protein 2 [Branchiostoma belcheri]